jgi:hypothetical protein
MSKDMEKHIGDIASTGVKNILYYIFFEPMVVGKHGMKDIGGCWKGPKNMAFEATKATQKDIMGAKNINV